MKEKKLLTTLSIAAMAAAFSVGGVLTYSTASAADATHNCEESAYCLVCDVADKINGLPEASEITIDNAADVIQQIHDIDRIKYDLSDEQFEELAEMVEIDYSYNMGHVVKYYDAIDAINSLDMCAELLVTKMIEIEGESLYDTADTEVTFEVVNLDTQKSTTLTMFDLSSSYSELGLDYYEQTADGWTFKYLLPAGRYEIREIVDAPMFANGKYWVNPEVTIQTSEGTFYGNTTTVTLTEGQEAPLLFTNSFDPFTTYNFVDESGVFVKGTVQFTDENMEGEYSATDGIATIKTTTQVSEGTLTILSLPDGYCNPGDLQYAVGTTSDESSDLTVEQIGSETTIKVVLHPHDYGSLVPQVSADCENDGFAAHYQCSKCSEYFDENKVATEREDLVISATGHDYGSLLPQVPADCDDYGFEAHYQCSKCSEYFDENKVKRTMQELAIAPKGHNYGELVPQVPAGCTTEGFSAHYRCEVCEEFFDINQVNRTVEELTINPTGHTYGALIEEVPADCESEGFAAHRRCQCGEKYFSENLLEVEYEDLILPKKGHSYGEWEVLKEATQKETGERRRECSVCHDVETEVIPVDTSLGMMILLVLLAIFAVAVLMFLFTKRE